MVVKINLKLIINSKLNCDSKVQQICSNMIPLIEALRRCAKLPMSNIRNGILAWTHTSNSNITKIKRIMTKSFANYELCEKIKRINNYSKFTKTTHTACE